MFIVHQPNSLYKNYNIHASAKYTYVSDTHYDNDMNNDTECYWLVYNMIQHAICLCLKCGLQCILEIVNCSCIIGTDQQLDNYKIIYYHDSTHIGFCQTGMYTAQI